ncbi:MAG: methyltransferase domain-containing protein [Actinomycetia bacterium]|nr:methyltransferase domain-containing protein [Actinomycetes bacterium]MCP3910620.1 methyltransferase domain-containing protein [Actinomycetes bacterium]MCP4084753.1 methyltransferase domain-containing protein [Actinomycetes bacterium]
MRNRLVSWLAALHLLGPAQRLKRRLGVQDRSTGLSGIDALDDGAFIDLAYEMVLNRPADQAGRENYLQHLRMGTRTRSHTLSEMKGSDEYWFDQALGNPDSLIALHRSRCLFVQQLPKAAQILDLGGTHQSNPEGAFVHLGYPYEFQRLVIVELPVDERHELYQHMKSGEPIQTALGPVQYSFHSMADLSTFEDNTFDLVYSGQTFEHVPEDVGDTVLTEVFRVLEPGGRLALDTPNGAACRLQLEGTDLTVTNPDHDIEYDHGPLRAKLEAAGFEIERQVGLTHLPQTFTANRLDPCELETIGVYDDIESCYVLAYVCRKPPFAPLTP